MVGIVLVSHSRPLATAAQELVRAMTGPGLPLAIAAGAGENHAELGTDAVEIGEAIVSVQGPDGVLVLMDMGSAILSAETALDLLDEKDRRNVRFCPAPFVEGAVAAGVTANLNAPLTEVFAEATGALRQKATALTGESAAPAAAETSAVPADALRLKLTIRNPHGLHARPAACLIGALKPFQAEVTVRNLSNGRGPVSARSLSGLATLEILQNHEIELALSGPDAEAARRRIAELAEGGFGETVPAKGTAQPAPSAPAVPAPVGEGQPVPISAGLAIGPVFYLQAAETVLPDHTVDDPVPEIERLRQAIAATAAELEARRVEIASRLGAASGGIYEAQALALQDPELTGRAEQLIRDERQNAARAWAAAGREVTDRYGALQDPYLRERAADIADVVSQVLERLGVGRSELPTPREPSILVARDLTPRQVAPLDPARWLGVILLEGGPTAHASILLKALGIPAIVRARSAGIERSTPALVAFDGTTGEIWPNPAPGRLGELKAQQAKQRARAEREKEAATHNGATADGHRVLVFANVGGEAEACGAAAAGAEGIGLLRTEFLFLDRSEPPTEEEQVQSLAAIATPLGDKPLVVRTLDIGGDKPVAYLPTPREDNPFLGVRALRLCFVRDDLFQAQLRAILRAAAGRDFRIMFPMVADLADLRRARACLERAHEELAAAGVAHRWPIEAGLMIEIPSAALQVEALAGLADFFSIGTNDLTQYTLAADRGNPALGPYQDALHPAVLRLVELVVKGAGHRLVAVCGEAASDEAAALILVGLGVTELSVAVSAIPRIKAALRALPLKALQQLAARALECHSAAEVRDLARQVLDATEPSPSRA